MFKKKQKGSTATVEWTISAPVIMMMVFLSCMFVLFVLNYYLYSHTASNLAQEMNMGDTGYATHTDNLNGITTEKYEHNVFFIPVRKGRKDISYNNGKLYSTRGENDCFRKSFNYFLNRYNDAGYLSFPFSTLESISAKVYYNDSEKTNFSNSSYTIESGDMVEVTINYSFIGLFNVQTRGYSFII